MALTKQQHDRRRRGIGASEIAAIAGLSRWATPAEVFEAKVRGRPDLDSYAAALGNEIEAPIARIWAKGRNCKIRDVDTLQHPARPLALATPDRAVFVLDPSGAPLRAKLQREHLAEAIGLLQVKSTTWRMAPYWGPEGTDDVPQEYLVQAHWEAAVSGVSEIIFAVDFDKTELREWRVVGSSAVFDALYEIAAKFWRDHVETGRPPPPDASERHKEFLSRWWPRENADAKVRPATPAEAALMAEFLVLREASKRLGQRKDLLYQSIATAIADGVGLVDETIGQVTFKATRERQVVDWQSLSHELRRVAGLAVMALDAVSSGCAPAASTVDVLKQDLESAITRFTTTKPGHRQMRWSKEVQALQPGDLIISDGTTKLHVQQLTQNDTEIES